MQDKNKIVEQFIKERVGQGIVDAFGDGISIQDTDFNILYQNSAHKEIIGDHQGEICYKAYEKREQVCDGCPVVESFLDGETHTAERTATTDKGIISVEITASPLRDLEGVIIAGIEIVRDITERKRIETSVIENEQKYSNLFNYSNDSIFIHDLDGNILDVNKKCLDVFGYSKSELLKLHVMELHPSSALEIAKSAFKTIIKTGFVNFEVDFKNKDGTTFIADVSSSIFKTGEKQVIQCVVRDITKRKQLGEKLSQSNERLFAILDSINALIYVADMETHEILFVNKYGENIFGDIIGQTCWKALQQEQTGPCEFCTNEHLVDVEGHLKGVYTWEFQNTANGRWYYIHDKAIQWQDGRIVRLEIATDITDRKRMEEELREATMTDFLTGLLNRRGFYTLAEQQGKLASRSNRAMALLYLDLDGFKNINDELGHDAGDKVLVETANILKNTFREADIIARIGGDEEI